MPSGGLGAARDPRSSALPKPDAPLVVVTAHRGSGKTTLLRRWFEEASAGGSQAVWFEVEAADNDLDHLRARLDRREGTHHRPIIVFIDDLEVIQSSESRRALIELVEQGSARLVVAQEHGPPLPVARLRPDELVAELGDAELRLREDDVERLVTERHLSLTAGGRAELLSATEGWALGIVTVLERLESAGQEPEGEVIDAALHDLATTMVEIIRSALDDADYEFLVGTSILEALEAGLCREVARPDATVELDRLAAVTPFMTRVDGTTGRVRMHGLARRGLRASLAAREHPDAIVARHRAAARWLEANGDISGAFEHSLGAGEPERAADLLALEWSVDASKVDRPAVDSVGAAGASDYVPHVVTTGLVADRFGDRAGLRRAVDWLAGAEWMGPLPHGFASLDSAVVTLVGRLPGFRTAAELERFVEVVARDETSTVEPPSLTGRSRAARALYLLGRFDEARDQAESVLLGHRSVGRHTAADRGGTVQASDLLALLEHDLGHGAEARRHLDHSDELAAHYNLPSSSASVGSAATSSRALVRAVIGGDPIEVRIAELDLRASEGPPTVQLYAAIELVRLLDRDRQVGEALAVLDKILTLIGDDEVPPLLAHRLGLLEESLRPGRRGEGPSIDVTASERSVLYLLADRSLSQSEIGSQLELSINTVKSHLRSIYQKFGVAGRAEAVAYAARRGLLVTVLPWGRPESLGRNHPG